MRVMKFCKHTDVGKKVNWATVKYTYLSSLGDPFGGIYTLFRRVFNRSWDANFESRNGC